MATKTVSCTQCPWTDERGVTTRTPSTCPQCGGSALVVDGQAVVEPAAKKPAPKRRR